MSRKIKTSKLRRLARSAPYVVKHMTDKKFSNLFFSHEERVGDALFYFYENARKYVEFKMENEPITNEEKNNIALLNHVY